MRITSGTKLTFLTIAWVTFVATTLLGAEKDGLRVEVVPKILADRSIPPSSQQFSTPVDQEMALKAMIKNISMKDAPDGSIDYIVLVQRWSAETGGFSSYKGTQKLGALKFGQQVEVEIGKYQLGGHLHGVAEYHKDKLAGWKIVVTQGPKKIEFSTPPNFEILNKGATATK